MEPYCMLYCPEVIKVMCKMIVASHSLRVIGKQKGLPSKATILRWLVDERKIEFRDAYRRAKQVQHWVIADQIHEAFEDGQYLVIQGQWGGRVHKLHLKSNARPADWLAAETERRARLKYGSA